MESYSLFHRGVLHEAFSAFRMRASNLPFAACPSPTSSREQLPRGIEKKRPPMRFGSFHGPPISILPSPSLSHSTGANVPARCRPAGPPAARLRFSKGYFRSKVVLVSVSHSVRIKGHREARGVVTKAVMTWHSLPEGRAGMPGHHQEAPATATGCADRRGS